jgi:HTH-type transcriptional regulator / antitoxin HigA
MAGTSAARKIWKADAPIERPIRNGKELARAVAEMDTLSDMAPRKGTREYDRLELLTVLIAAYEAEHVPPLRAVSPQQVVQFMAEQKNISQGELAELLGGRSRLSDFLNGVRALSKGQIIKLRDALGIPADLLIASD